MSRTANGRKKRSGLNLTPQQQAVFGLLCSGHDRKEICDKLRLAKNTVDEHIARTKRSIHHAGWKDSQLVVWGIVMGIKPV